MRVRAFVSLLALCACDSAPASVSKPPPPPPLPALTAKPTPSAEPEPTPVPSEPAAPHEKPEHHGARHASAEPAPARESQPAKPVKASSAATKAPVAKPAAPTPAAPAPAAPAPSVATTPKSETKVSVPKTTHVQIDVPAGLQADLNHDPRMQPWVNQVVATIDRCYASESKSSKLAGTIEVLVTMHENERPDADIKQLPPALSPLVACATGGLMRTKMPLFTGQENSRYSVKLRFAP